MKKKLFVHIGTHKTGTTSLQVFLDKHQDDLLAQDFFYPKIGWYHHAQHMLAFHLQNVYPAHMPKPEDNIWEQLNEIIESNNCNKVILSSEEFSVIDKSAIEKLKNYLKNFEVKIIVYLRSQVSLFESMYNQQVKDWKSPRKEPINFFLTMPELIYQKFNYLENLKNWAEFFGKENIIVEVYKDYSTIDSFSNIVGIDKSKINNSASTIDVNKSISLKSLEIMRLSKHLIKDEDIRKKLFFLSTSLFSPFKNESLLAMEEKISFMEIYSNSNEELKNLFLPNIDNLFLTSEFDKNVKIDLTRKDLFEIIEKLLMDSN